MQGETYHNMIQQYPKVTVEVLVAEVLQCLNDLPHGCKVKIGATQPPNFCLALSMLTFVNNDKKTCYISFGFVNKDPSSGHRPCWHVDYVNMVRPKWLVIQLGWDIRGRRSCEVVGCAILTRFVESQSPEWWLTGIAQCPPPRWNQKASWAQCPRWHTSNKIHAIHAKLLCKNSKPMKKKWVNHWTLK